MLLKYNVTNLTHNKRVLNVRDTQVQLMDNNRDYLVIFTTDNSHNLSVNDKIVISRAILTAQTYSEAYILLKDNTYDMIQVLNDEDVLEKNHLQQDVLVTYSKGYYKNINNKLHLLNESDISANWKNYSSVNLELSVISEHFSEKTFAVVYPKYQQLNIVDINDNESLAVVKVDNFPLVLPTNTKVTLYKTLYLYMYDREATSEDKDLFECNTNPSNSTVYLGVDYVVYFDKIYKWQIRYTPISCTYLDNFYFECNYEDDILFKNDSINIEDIRFINNGITRNDLIISEYSTSINLNLPLGEVFKNDVHHDNIIRQYFNERKTELIPDIIDYEKQCFSPYYRSNNKLVAANKLTFNLFLRDRSQNEESTLNEEWITNDSLGWNQYKLIWDENTETETFTLTKPLTKGDVIGYMGFTDNDIYNRKEKVNKTFIRLSFYSSNNPTNQMLLFYSTIFLDSTSLYNKYIHNLSLKNDSMVDLVFNDELGDDTLTLTFSVEDKYNKHNSSEGFYLYLYPENIHKFGKKTIYMKVELHNAGNGKTIPLIYPNDNIAPLTFGENFPTSLNNLDGNLNEYYRQLYIPLTLDYDTSTQNYMYYFDIVTINKGELVFNLFEPRINSLL